MYKHILIATDGSELATEAVTHGLQFAKLCKAVVTVVTVTEPFHSLGDKQHMFSGLPEAQRRQAISFLFDQATKLLDEVAACAQSAGVKCELKLVENSNPYDGIIATAKQCGCDLIVMASHGRSGVSKLLLGSQTMKVLTHTDIPVLVCR